MRGGDANKGSQRTGDSIHEVISTYSTMVYRLAYARTGNKADAEDIFQEVFLKYCAARQEFDSEEHRTAWLIRSTVNASVDLFRSAWRRLVALNAEVDNSLSLDINTNMAYDDAKGAWTLPAGEKKARISVSVGGSPLHQPPVSIRFVPTCELKREEGESSGAYYGRMAALADGADAFTVELKR